MEIQTKRVYDAKSEDDGYRVLVDRLWPRGLSKEKAQIDLWAKNVAPSKELRQWFHHDEKLFDEFARKYREELADNEAVSELLSQLKKQHCERVCLLYAAKNKDCNQAVVLKKYLEEKLNGSN